MTDPKNPRDADAVREELRSELAAERSRGREPEPSEYLSRWPGFESEVRDEMERLGLSLQRLAGDDPDPPTGQPVSGADPADYVDGIPRQLGPYRLIEEIGRGGQGRVFRAEDTRLGRVVAVKVLQIRSTSDGSVLARFEREARIAARVGGEGICGVLDVGLEAHTPWIAMDFVEGETLSAIIGRTRPERQAATSSTPITIGEGPRTEADTEPDTSRAGEGLQRRIRRVMVLVEEIARILQRAHDAGVVHRDLKPGNVMIRPDGRPVILDFGLATSEDDQAGLTMTGDVFGTPAYMAPEQIALGTAAAGPSADVWALGVILHECLSGQRPFTGASRKAIFAAIEKSEATPSLANEPAIPRDLAVVAEAALRKDPGDRYLTAGALADDLRRILDHRPIAVRPVPRRIKMVRWIQRNRTLAASTAIVLLSLVAGLVATTSQARRAENALDDWARLAGGALYNELVAKAPDELFPLRVGRRDHVESWRAELEELIRARPGHVEAIDNLRRMSGRITGHDDSAEVEEYRDRVRRMTQLLQRRIVRQEERINAWNLCPAPDIRARMQEEPWNLLRKYQAEYQALNSALNKKISPKAQWTLRTAAQQLQHDELVTLDQELEKAEHRASFWKPGLRTAVRVLEILDAFERSVQQDHRLSWASAIERVKVSPHYEGLELTAQDGLVPLGPDPVSGLEEFAQLETGSIPVRREDGKLPILHDMAVIFVLLPGGRVEVGAWNALTRTTEPGEGESRLARGAQARLLNLPPEMIDFAPFFISKYELTKWQWITIAGEAAGEQLGGRTYLSDTRGPINFRSRPEGRFENVPDDCARPARSIDWFDARHACRIFGWALPTEAQWEYACRGGTRTMWPWPGEREEHWRHANLVDYCIAFQSNSHRSSPTVRKWSDGHGFMSPVGSYEPNGYGLHDMIGNVAEWCLDPYHGEAYGLPTRAGDGLRLLPESERVVVRGGSYMSEPESVGSTLRGSTAPTTRLEIYGLRPVRKLER